MRQIILVLLLLTSVAGLSQQYINKSKSEVKKLLDKSYFDFHGISAKIIETDSSTTREGKVPGGVSTDKVYLFDKSGKCSSEKIITNCDSCYEWLLKGVLDNKKYRWKQINLNQYVSKYTKGMLIETQVIDNIFSFTILRTDLNRKTYRSLIKNK